MIIKVCGIKESRNYQDISQLRLDMIGVNFYEPSARFIGKTLLEPKNQPRAGVFVRASIEEILAAKEIHQLDYAQLHGDESAVFCSQVALHIPVIKVFRVDDSFDWGNIPLYKDCEYFLFDTKTAAFGGSGRQFDWDVLNEYQGAIPFLLSGGIGPKDVTQILEVNHPQFRGVDINSKFETAPGIKDVEMVRTFISELRN